MKEIEEDKSVKKFWEEISTKKKKKIEMSKKIKEM